MCGIAGAWFPLEAREAGIKVCNLLADMTAGQQHRGHEGVGINTATHGDKSEFARHKGLGLVFDVFDEREIQRLEGDCGIAHNRYSTSGKPSVGNVQPFYSVIDGGSIAEQVSVAHNGNLTNELVGVRPSKSDTWCILHNLDGVNHKRQLHLRIFQALKNLEGAFSLTFLYQDENGKVSLICVRDPHGIRPLWLAKYNFQVGTEEETGYLAASETCAFDKVPGAEILRPIKPGEIVVINDLGIKSFRPKAWKNQARAHCIFEIIYFMHPTSIIETPNFRQKPAYAYEVQEAFGMKLAMENSDLKTNAVFAIPDSSKFHTNGFSQISGIRQATHVLRNHSVGRTFITPPNEDPAKKEHDRDEKIRRKFSFIFKRILEAPSSMAIEDSLVRGNTLKRIIKIIRSAAKKAKKKLEIIIGIASPAVKYPCFQGIDMSTKEELAWNKFSGLAGVKKAINADNLRYLSVEGMFEVAENVTGHPKNTWCAACFTGEYPVGIAREEYIEQLTK